MSELVNIDEAALTILREARKAAEVILARRAEMDAAGQGDKPLVVLAGENHLMVAHHLFHMAVLNRLQKTEPEIAAAMEIPHDTLKKSFLKRAHIPAFLGRREKLWNQIENADKNGKLRAKNWLGFIQTVLANYSFFSQVHFINERGIPLHFTDASQTYNFLRTKNWLNMNDFLTRQSFQVFGKSAQMPVNAVSLEGMRIRNHHMAGKLSAIPARIIYQACGITHVAGDVEDGHLASHSLSAYCKENGLSVLAMPLFLESFGDKELPTDHNLQQDELHSVEGLLDVSALYESIFSYSETQRQEATLINAILRHPAFQEEGLDKYALSVPKKKALQLKNEFYMHCVFNGLIKPDAGLPLFKGRGSSPSPA